LQPVFVIYSWVSATFQKLTGFDRPNAAARQFIRFGGVRSIRTIRLMTITGAIVVLPVNRGIIRTNGCFDHPYVFDSGGRATTK